MKLVVFREENKERVGIKTEEGIYPIEKSLKEIISNGLNNGNDIENLIDLTSGVLSEEEIEFLPCVPPGKKIICVGLNYRRHAEEAGMPIPEVPVLFNKFENALTAQDKEVTLPNVAKQYDYEAELGIVIGKQAKQISRENALDYVFGYCAVNDISARDLQLRTPQWLLGKSLDGFCPVGPYVVTADEVGNPNELGIRCFLNGELRQNSNTSDMIFKVDEIVSFISTYITLEPGDLILTGTPEGVIAGYPEEQREWLKSGDQVKVEIDKIGQLTNYFI
ncbi:fumarylacetoacetate hydrolase family protein [Alkalihalobacterium alkalinitrilicum]|uniref:fumarylacetoacetate hydrolase family protein n=1 Tax=Alkalihalobacterium alkalinitrilicum TaxID=427920 RepID=UPI000995C80C|nr:fumarylacetoacetate hydrolase family protein [Alkalihalobacterium alkalinitrilicum]